MASPQTDIILLHDSTNKNDVNTLENLLNNENFNIKIIDCKALPIQSVKSEIQNHKDDAFILLTARASNKDLTTLLRRKLEEESTHFVHLNKEVLLEKKASEQDPSIFTYVQIQGNNELKRRLNKLIDKRRLNQ